MARKTQSRKLARKIKRSVKRSVKNHKSSRRHTKKHMRNHRLYKKGGAATDHEIIVSILNHFLNNNIDNIGYLAFLLFINGDKNNDENINEENKLFKKCLDQQIDNIQNNNEKSEKINKYISSFKNFVNKLLSHKTELVASLQNLKNEISQKDIDAQTQLNDLKSILRKNELSTPDYFLYEFPCGIIHDGKITYTVDCNPENPNYVNVLIDTIVTRLSFISNSVESTKIYEFLQTKYSDIQSSLASASSESPSASSESPSASSESPSPSAPSESASSSQATEQPLIKPASSFMMRTANTAIEKAKSLSSFLIPKGVKKSQ